MRRRILRVSDRGGADHRSIGGALAVAEAGDLVLVEPGVYSEGKTGERFPLFVPPGVILRGAGAASTIIDGDGALAPSFRPFRPEESLLVVRDRARVQGFTVQHAGGSGVGVVKGARCVVTDNVLRENGLHGLLICGAGEAVVRNCSFQHNGKSRLSVPTYRPRPAHPGEAIFVVCLSGADNRVLIERNEFEGSSGGECVTMATDPDDDAATAHIKIFDNHIRGARIALLLLGSFGGSHNTWDVEIAGNDVRGADCAFIACAAYPFVSREAAHNRVRLVARNNVFRECGEGVQLLGAFAASHDNELDVDFIDNNLFGIGGTALRIVGALGGVDAAAERNRVTCRALNNTTSGIKRRSVVIDGASMEVENGVLSRGNDAVVQLLDNSWEAPPGAAPILVRDGPPGNRVLLEPRADCDVDGGIAMWWE